MYCVLIEYSSDYKRLILLSLSDIFLRRVSYNMILDPSVSEGKVLLLFRIGFFKETLSDIMPESFCLSNSRSNFTPNDFLRELGLINYLGCTLNKGFSSDFY